jgi:hypothetical protein
MRKPLTGLLTLRIHGVSDVDHATSSRFSRGPETFIVIKVEDTIKARTKATRTDRWQDETFNIDIDKANEIELTVYDKAGDRPTPIGMLWVRISDIAEEMRRKKLESELNASGWVSADKMGGDGGTSGRPDTAGQPGSPHAPGSAGHSGVPAQGYGGAPSGAPSNSVMIESWFALEPVGRIHLSMSFGMPLLSLGQCSAGGYTDIFYSQTCEGSATIRYWSEPSGCRPTEEGRSSRKAGTQVCHSTVLQYHALCSVWRFLEICRRHAMCRLQVYMSPQVLSEGCHQMYQQGKLRNRPRRGEDQPPYSTSVRDLLQPLCQLVLPLRVPTAFRT